MKKLSIGTLLLVLTLGHSFARDKSKVVNTEMIKVVEQKVNETLKEESANKSSKYHLYALAARELMGYGHYEKSLEYYEKALATNLKSGMEESYYNKLFVLYRLNRSKNELGKALSDLENYLEKNKLKKTYAPVLTSWNALLKSGTKIDEEAINGFFGAHYAQSKMIELVKSKKFVQALNLLPKDLKNANINLQIQSDILKTIVFGKKQPLYCSKKLKKYSNSKAYTMEICRYLSKGTKTSLTSVKNRIEKESPRRLFWVEAMKEIK
jgi:tetratricopeptide (TPR) repeat protein